MNYESIASAFAYVLGHGIWGSMLIFLAAAGTIRLIDMAKGTNAATRHAIWMGSLAGVLVLHAVLATTLFMGPTSGDNAPPAEATLHSETSLPTETALETARAPQAETTSQIQAASPSESVPVALDMATEAGPASTSVPTSGTAVKGAVIRLPAIAALGLLILGVIWLAGLLFGGTRLLLAVRGVSRVKQDSVAIGPSMQSRIRVKAPGIRRDFDLAEGSIQSPVAAGYLRPTVLVPRDLLESTDEDTFEQLALHEVAHIARGDDWGMLFQRLVEAVLWVNPAVHIIGNKLQIEREMACDEWVVASTQEPERYARSLGQWMELGAGVTEFAVTPGLAAKESDIVGRVRRLLDKGRSFSSHRPPEQVAVALALVLLVVALAAVRAPAIEFFSRDSDGSQEMRAQVASFSAPTPPVAPTAPLPPLPPLAPRPPLAPIAPVAPVAPVPPMPPLAPEPDPLTPLAPSPELFRAAEAALASVPSADSAIAVLEARAPKESTARSAETSAVRPERRTAGEAETVVPAYADQSTRDVDLTTAGWKRLFSVAKGISSSGERRRVLIAAVGKMPSNTEVHLAFVDAASSISSSSDRAQTLLAFVQNQEASPEVFRALIKATTEIASSGNRVRLLMAIGAIAPSEESVEEALMGAVDSIVSASDRSRVLQALIRR